jgi:tetratricopeptide (TPR) repeat protein
MATNPKPAPNGNARASRYLAKARGHQVAGRLQLAVKTYKDYLRVSPSDAECWHQLGGLEYQLGATREAVRCLKRAVELRPELPELRNDLAGLLLADGRPEAAEECYRDILTAFPGFVPALYNLADLCFRQDRRAESIEYLVEVVAKCPEWAEAHFNLAIARERAGEIGTALLSMKQAYALNPNLPRIHAKLGGLCKALHYHHEAIEHFKRAFVLDPDDVDIVIGLAEVQAAEGGSDESLTLLQSFFVRHPDNARVAVALGDLWTAKGDTGNAERHYDLALQIEPGNADAIYGKTWARKYTNADSAWISHLEQVTTGKAMDEAVRSTAYFALGKVYDDRKQFDLAFENVAEANRICRRANARLRYDHAAHEDYIGAIIETGSAVWVAQLTSAHGTDSELPVLIVGMPRSGTTLAEQIISSHPRAHGAGELVYFTSLADLLPAQIPGGDSYPACLKHLGPDISNRIITGYLELLRRHSTSAARVIDKNPFNFLHLGLIAGLFPNAHIIECRRDPLDVCLSIYFQSFNTYSSFAWDLNDIGHYYLQYRRLMRHWRSVFPDRIATLDYELMVDNQETASRELVANCGLEWDDTCLRFHETRRDVKTASVWQVRRPIYQTSKKRWMNYADHISPLRELLANAPL